MQYLYITNLSGDIVGLTDAQGNLLAEYAYDEWGKLISIDAEGEENRAIAELNPLRYRGYYYDNETGYYYLQSRYYDPDICRFISADSFEYLDTSNRFNMNAYVYCWNCPIAFDDAEGTTPKLSFDISKIKAFIVKIEGYIERTKNKLSDAKDWIVSKWQKMVDFCLNFKEKIKSKFDEFGEKAKFKIHNIYIYINDIYKKITGRDLNLFRIVEFVKENIINTDDTDNAEQGISLFSLKKAPSVSEEGKVVAVVITEIFTCLDLETIAAAFKIDFTFNDLWDYMQIKVDLYKKAFDEGVPGDFSTNLSASLKKAVDASAKFSVFMSFFEFFSDDIKNAASATPYLLSIINNISGRYLSPVGALFMSLLDVGMNGLFDVSSSVISKQLSPIAGALSPIVGALFGIICGEVYDAIGTRNKAEFIAYNWYYLFFVDWSEI